jgi:hypothetical protein
LATYVISATYFLVEAFLVLGVFFATVLAVAFFTGFFATVVLLLGEPFDWASAAAGIPMQKAVSSATSAVVRFIFILPWVMRLCPS